MQDTDLLYTPVWQLRELLDTRQVSSVELTETFLRRIEQLNPKLNAYLIVTGDEALAAAKAADEMIGQGQAGPLLGIPISLKGSEFTKIYIPRPVRVIFTPPPPIQLESCNILIL